MSPAVGVAVFWVAATCCLVAQIAVIRSAARSPMPGSRAGDVIVPRRSSEIVWTIVPAVALAVALVFTWRAMHRPPPAPIMIMPDGHRMIEE